VWRPSCHVVEESFSDESERCVVILCQIIFVSLITHFIVILPRRGSRKGRGNRQNLRNTSNIINVVAQSNEQIKEELTASLLHLHLHSPATLECASTADYEGEVVSPKFGVGVGSISICVAGRREDSAALNARFYSFKRSVTI